jgi:hypothetical protein
LDFEWRRVSRDGFMTLSVARLSPLRERRSAQNGRREETVLAAFVDDEGIAILFRGLVRKHDRASRGWISDQRDSSHLADAVGHRRIERAPAFAEKICGLRRGRLSTSPTIERSPPSGDSWGSSRSSVEPGRFPSVDDKAESARRENCCHGACGTGWNVMAVRDRPMCFGQSTAR